MTLTVFPGGSDTANIPLRGRYEAKWLWMEWDAWGSWFIAQRYRQEMEPW